MAGAWSDPEFLKQLGITVGVPIGLGTALGMVRDSGTEGYNAVALSMAGAQIGLLRSGLKGGLLGAAIGAAAGGATAGLGDKLGGGIGGAVASGISTSVAGSLMMAGNMRGGLAHSMYEKTLSSFGASKEQIAATFNKIGIDFYGPTGLAMNMTDMIHSLVGQPGWVGKIGKLSPFFKAHPTASSLINATLGSPRLIEATKAAGGFEKISWGTLGKAVAWDVAEGVPLGLAFGLAALPFRSNKIKGMSDEGIAKKKRNAYTPF